MIDPDIAEAAKAICRAVHPQLSIDEPLFPNLPAWVPSASLPAWQHYVEAAQAAFDLKPKYDNTPTVVVVLVPCNEGLLMIRRRTPNGFGKLAIPGGFQEKPQTWQETAVKEVKEETGVDINATTLRLLSVSTVPDRGVNLLFCLADPVTHAGEFVHDHEVSEVLIVKEAVETAFPLHTVEVEKFFLTRA